MKSRVIRSLAVAFAAAALCLAAPSAARAQSAKITLTATPLPLNQDDARQVRVGRLQYRGGLELRADNVRFGGLSGLHVSSDGATLVAMSDNGRWVRMTLEYDKQGDLNGARDGLLRRIIPAEGYRLRGNWRDAEAIAPDGSGGYFVSFERQHRIWHYRTPPSDPFESTPVPLKGPADIEDQPNNGGIEGMARLCDRRLLIFSEQATTDDGDAKAWVFDGKQWKGLRYATASTFHPTGATVLPDCNLAILERSFTPSRGVRARVVFVPAKDIRPGAALRGEVLAEFALPLTVDNMEGIAARKGGNGETLIYLVSDDNFSGFQRTMLTMFELLPPAEKK
jgi:hypothetical protein